LFVGGDVSLNSRLFVGGDVSLNSRLFVGGDVSFQKNLFVSGNSTFSGNVLVNTQLRSIGNIKCDSIMNVTGDIVGNSYIYGYGYDTTNNNTIYIGASSGSRSINIGYNISNLGSSNVITLGNPSDTVIFNGNTFMQNVGIRSKTLILNDEDDTGDSAGSGILFYDNHHADSGYMIMSTDMHGFIFRSSRPQNQSQLSNRVRLDTETITCPTSVNSGLLRFTPSSGLYPDSDYTISSCNQLYFDTSSAFHSTNLSIFHNDISGNGNIRINGNTFLNNTTTTSTNTNSVALNVLGITSTNNNPIFQF